MIIPVTNKMLPGYRLHNFARNCGYSLGPGVCEAIDAFIALNHHRLVSAQWTGESLSLLGATDHRDFIVSVITSACALAERDGRRQAKAADVELVLFIANLFLPCQMPP